MYAIKQTYTSYTQPEASMTRVLKRRYKTIQGAEKAAQAYRWICRPQGINDPVAEESRASVITVEN